MSLGKLCRFCLDCNSLLLPLFEINLTDAEHPVALSEFLESFLKDPVQENDENPQHLCVICLNQIKRFYEFKIKCDRAFVRFRDFDISKDIDGKTIKVTETGNQFGSLHTDTNGYILRSMLEKSESKTQAQEPEPPIYLFDEPIGEAQPHRQGLPVIPLSSLLKVVQFFKTSNLKSKSNLYKVVLGEKRIRRRKPIEFDADGNINVIPANREEIAQSTALCIDTPYCVDQQPIAGAELSSAPYSDHDYANPDPKNAFFKVRKKADIQPKVYAADESGRVDQRVCWPNNFADKVVKATQAPTTTSQVVQPPELVLLPPSKPAKKFPQESDRVKCPVADCEIMFYHSNDILKHLIAAHTAEHECLVCFAKDLRIMSKHCRIHLPHLFTCVICEKGFATMMELKSHREKAVAEKFKCNPCNKLFCQPKDYKRHQKKHEVELQGSYKIRMCCATEYFTKEDFTQHRAQDHVELLRACKLCPEKFRTLRQLAKHEAEVHPNAKEPKEYKCPDCPMTFTLKLALASHSRQHKPDQNSQGDDISRRRCDVCFSVYPHIKKMQKHRKSHFQAPIMCKLCNRYFPNKVKHKVHMTYFHSDRRKYRCEVCNKSFKYNGNLRSHQMSKNHKRIMAAIQSASSDVNTVEFQNTSTDKENESSGDEAIEPEVEC